MKLKQYGFFKELEHGSPHGESIKCLRNSASYDKSQMERIVKCFRSGHVFIASPGVVFDAFKEDKSIPIGNAHILTDGEWCWPADLSYYVQYYRIPIPKEMLESMKKTIGAFREMSTLQN